MEIRRAITRTARDRSHVIVTRRRDLEDLFRVPIRIGSRGRPTSSGLGWTIVKLLS